MNNLKKYRKDKNLTVTELAKRSKGEFSQSRLSNYETGARSLTIDAAKKLAVLLDVSPSQLLGLSDNYFTDVKLGAHQEELIKILSEVSLRGDQDVRRVIAILKGYLDS